MCIAPRPLNTPLNGSFSLFCTLKGRKSQHYCRGGSPSCVARANNFLSVFETQRRQRITAKRGAPTPFGATTGPNAPVWDKKLAQERFDFSTFIRTLVGLKLPVFITVRPPISTGLMLILLSVLILSVCISWLAKETSRRRLFVARAGD